MRSRTTTASKPRKPDLGTSGQQPSTIPRKLDGSPNRVETHRACSGWAETEDALVDVAGDWAGPRPTGAATEEGRAPEIAERGERLLQELFGTPPDHPQPSTHAVPRALSIYEELHGLLLSCRPDVGDYRPLSPGPTTNRCLSRLVAILRGQHSPQEADPPLSQARAVERFVLDRIAASPELTAKAARIRQAAGLAEAEMERHYCALLVDRLQHAHPELYAEGNGMVRLRTALAGFPYLDSYEQLTRAEITLLSRPVVPRLLPDARRERLSSRTSTRLHTLQHELQRYLQTTRLPLTRSGQGLQHSTLAVCGCGPLPVTGLMMHALTGARVVLVDNDPAAVTAAGQLVHTLERLQVLPAGALQVVEADVAELEVRPSDRGSTPQQTGSVKVLYCDALLIASLVPEAAKQRLAQRLRSTPAAAPLSLLLRTARGLCAQLAYAPVNTLSINDLQLAYCGLLTPSNQVPETTSEAINNCAEELSPGSDAPAVHAGSEVLHVAPSNVLNCTELYYRLPLPCDKQTLRFDADDLRHDVEYAIHLLQRAGAS